MAKRKSNKLASIIGLEIIICVVICVVAVFSFLYLTNFVFTNKFVDLDNSIINHTFKSLNPDLTRKMVFISAFGSSIFIFTASVMFAGYLYLRKKVDAFIFISILYTAIFLNIMLKFLYGRPRPEMNPLVIENSFSYPSFHAMISFVFYSAVAYFFYKETKNIALTIFISIIFGILIFLIGYSRVYLGVHYPSDIIAGYLAGLIWLMVVILFQRTYLFERLYDKSIKKK